MSRGWRWWGRRVNGVCGLVDSEDHGGEVLRLMHLWMDEWILVIAGDPASLILSIAEIQKTAYDSEGISTPGADAGMKIDAGSRTRFCSPRNTLGDRCLGDNHWTGSRMTRLVFGNGDVSLVGPAGV